MQTVYQIVLINILSILCILLEVLSGAHAKREKGLYDFQFSTFIFRFPKAGVGSVAVKGLKSFHISDIGLIV